jgi:prophage regulatory protein
MRMPPTAPDRFLRLPDVLARVGHRRTSWLDAVAAGRAPAAIRIGTRAVAWSEREIDAWMETRKTESRR